MILIENLKLYDEAFCLSERSLLTLEKHSHTLMRVASQFGDHNIKAVRCTIKGKPGEWIADKITGALYHPETGVCATAPHKRIVGEAEAAEKVERPRFAYGYQKIKARAEEGAKKGRGAPGGARNGKAKVNEEIVRDIRTLKSDGTYAITISQACSLYGIGKDAVLNIRTRRTWSHVQ